MHSLPDPFISALDGGEAFEVLPGSVRSGALVLADHASNAMPPEYGALGMPEAQLRRHIAYDIGVDALSRRLAARLGCPAVLTRFSRLLIDPNRGDDDPTLVMRLSDGAIVPGNARIGADEVARRQQRLSLPYHGAVAAVISRMLTEGVVPVVLSMHSFTPSMKGRDRPWHVGVLWDADPRLPVPLLDALRQDEALVVGDNEPYDGALEGDTMFRHCTALGLAHALIEVRQDLIADAADAAAWGEKLADVLEPLLMKPEMHVQRHFASRTGKMR